MGGVLEDADKRLEKAQQEAKAKEAKEQRDKMEAQAEEAEKQKIKQDRDEHILY
jgi:hypothetical protein